MSDKTFLSWVVRSPKGIGGVFVAFFYVVAVYSKSIPSLMSIVPSYGSHEAGYKTFFESVPSALQCLALLPPLFQYAKIAPPGEKPANKACNQFGKCLSALIASWILFYFLIFLSQWKLIVRQEPWIDLLNNFQAVFLFSCYWTLTAITVPEPGSDRPTLRESISLPLIFSFSLWGVLVFHLADLFLSSSGSVAIRFWFQLLSGLAVGVCMALVVGCLESEYFGPQRLWTALLYCYAVLQLSYLGFNLPQSPQPPSVERVLQEFATITSLPLKLLFVGFCYWAMQTGRMAFYMEKTRGLLKDVPSQWDDYRDAA